MAFGAKVKDWLRQPLSRDVIVERVAFRAKVAAQLVAFISQCADMCVNIRITH